MEGGHHELVGDEKRRTVSGGLSLKFSALCVRQFGGDLGDEASLAVEALGR